MESVLKLDGRARYDHFVKRVVDAGEAYGLWQDGWALMRDDQGNDVLPLWPAIEYAEASRGETWVEYRPERIDLADLLDDLLPTLARTRVLPGVFPTPDDTGVTPTVGDLEASLRTEMEKYGE